MARSLRAGLNVVELIAKDHSTLASGLHSEVFDSAWICRPWSELDLALHASEIEAQLGERGVFLPGSDVEVAWCARAQIRGAIVPPVAALEAVAKPLIPAARGLPCAVPPAVSLEAGQRRVLEFCEENGWEVWLKGPAYDARHVASWSALVHAEAELGRIWKTRAFFVQASVRGHEWCVAGAAVDGRLLGAVEMEKRLSTERGKTWAGAVGDVAPAFLAALESTLRALRWSGGFELEFVRDDEGTAWLIDWNARFPAWIHGATLAGVNLPARLVAAVSGAGPVRELARCRHFVRVIEEIPTRAELPLGSRTIQGREPRSLEKHPSNFPSLGERLVVARPPPAAALSPLPEALLRDLTVASRCALTPARVRLEETARRRIQQMIGRARAASPLLRVAFSVKTHPDADLLRLAHDAGALVEVISRGELDLARREGVPAGEVIYNGPVPLRTPPGRVRAAFADSIEAATRYFEERPATLPGVRLRPPEVRSRFGVDLADPDEHGALLDLLSGTRGRPVAFSMHVAPSVIGAVAWRRLAAWFVAAVRDLAVGSGATVAALDLGGGWTPAQLDRAFASDLGELMRDVSAKLSAVEECVIEPGKALVEEGFALIASVVEVRRRGGRRECVVDASVAELPHALARPHRIVAPLDSAHALPPGEDLILGRLCMEDDILAASVALPCDLREGDRVAFLDAGAYSASMAWPFGQGVRWVGT